MEILIGERKDENISADGGKSRDRGTDHRRGTGQASAGYGERESSEGRKKLSRPGGAGPRTISKFRFEVA